MGKNNKTFVEKIPFSKESLVQFRQNYTNDPSEKSRYLLDYPTVYIANDKYRGKYSVYVGETLIFIEEPLNIWRLIMPLVMNGIYLIIVIIHHYI